MYARLVNELPEGNEWLYEVKFDGYRCLAGRDGKGVILWSRRRNFFTKQFPHIAQACERIPRGTLVDGEIVALDANGRISFNLLQRHRSRATAIEADEHLYRCLIYIDLNMVRARVVNHPLKWLHGGYREIQEPPNRYAVIDLKGLAALCGFTDLGLFKAKALWGQKPYGVRSLFLLFCCVGAVPEKACRQQLTSGMRQALLWGSHLDLWS